MSSADRSQTGRSRRQGRTGAAPRKSTDSYEPSGDRTRAKPSPPERKKPRMKDTGTVRICNQPDRLAPAFRGVAFAQEAALVGLASLQSVRTRTHRSPSGRKQSCRRRRPCRREHLPHYRPGRGAKSQRPRTPGPRTQSRPTATRAPERKSTRAISAPGARAPA